MSITAWVTPRGGRPSPFVWASTNQYAKGKYVADGHYDPNAVDHQLGCAALLIRMATMDQSVKSSPRRLAAHVRLPRRVRDAMIRCGRDAA